MKIGLALGSGGAKGYAHIAYLKVIDEVGLRVSHISGASMGALIGALYAGGMSAAEMLKLLESFSVLEITRLFELSRLKRSGLIRGQKVEKFLSRLLPVARFDQLQIPLEIVATDFTHKRQVVFNEGPLLPAIRASISIPGVFQAYRHQNSLLIDGGVVNPVPFDLLAKHCDYIICIDVSGEREVDEENPPGAIDVLLGTFQIMQRIIIEQREPQRHVKIYCKPRIRGIRALELHRFREVLEMVAEDAEKFKQQLQQQGLIAAGRC
jgi:NTE family protein